MGISGSNSGASSVGLDNEYDDTDLKTPLAGFGSGSEDRNPTVQARGKDYEESSYGYGLTGNGLSDNGDAASTYLNELRSVVRGSPNPSSSNLPLSRSRANSNASRRTASSRRGSSVGHDDLLSLSHLSITQDEPFGLGVGGSRRSSADAEGDKSEDEDGQKGDPDSPVFDPEDLVHIRRLGEGTGGAVELVQDPRTGRIMAKKVGPRLHRHTSFCVC